MKSIALTSAKAWWKRDPFTDSAAISYYTIFSLPSLIILLMGLASLLLDKDYIQQKIQEYLRLYVGQDAANMTLEVARRVEINDKNFIILSISLTLLVFTSLRLFQQIQKALNRIWDIPSETVKWKRVILRRVSSFLMMLSIGLVMLLSVLTTSALTILGDWLSQYLAPSLQRVFHALNISASLLLLSFLFCLIFRILPDRHIPWRAAWRGGLVSGLLFLLGQYGLGFYFEIARPESAYGVSGSLILLMLWVSYSTLILLYGAEYANAYMQRDASRESAS